MSNIIVCNLVIVLKLIQKKVVNVAFTAAIFTKDMLKLFIFAL